MVACEFLALVIQVRILARQPLCASDRDALKNQLIFMATIKEWVRDFKKKPKWDKFCIIFTIVAFFIGLILGGKSLLFIKNQTQEEPVFKINESANVALNYKSPYSPITINETIISEDCDSKIYKNNLTLNIKKFFTKIDENLIYDLSNVKIILPSKQELYIDEMKNDQNYLIAYSNDDCSSACVVHKYRIPSDFNENEVCFYMTAYGNPCGEGNNSKLSLSMGPRFIEDRESCYEQVMGDSDFLKNWCQ